jgi:probable HAF family extracellular repeat protein
VSARDINDLDQIVGDAADPGTGLSQAFLSETGKHGRIALTTLINLPGYANSVAHAINNIGQVVGQSDTNSSNATAWIWQRGKKSREVITALPALGSNPIVPGFHEQTEATGINDAGSIVGFSDNDSLQQHAVIWRPGKKGRYGATDLGALPAPLPTSDARAINQEGYAVGYSLGNDNRDHAVLFVPGKKGRYSLVELPDFGNADVEALAINNQNQIVGLSIGTNGEDHAMLWQPGKHGRYTAVDLFSAGGSAWQLNDATDINDAGTIVGTGVTEGGNSTWRLTPTPSVSMPAAVVASVFSNTPIGDGNADLFQ